jgi:hypothetical protein
MKSEGSDERLQSGQNEWFQPRDSSVDKVRLQRGEQRREWDERRIVNRRRRVPQVFGNRIRVKAADRDDQRRITRAPEAATLGEWVTDISRLLSRKVTAEIVTRLCGTST